MKALKLFAVIVIFLALLIGGVLVYVFGNINEIVKQVVETEGPKVTKTAVTLQDVDIKLLDGRGELNHFKIANPSGFSSDYILKWDTIAVQIDTSSVRSDVVVLEEVEVKGVKIIVEQKSLDTNIQTLLDSIKGDSPQEEEETSSSTGKASKDEDTEEVRLAVKHLVFADNDIEIVTEKWGSFNVSLPSIELHDLGSKDQGLTPEELGKAILKPMLKQVKDRAEDSVKSFSEEKLKAKLEEKKAELKEKAAEKKAEIDQKLGEKKQELKDKLAEKKAELEESEHIDSDALKEKEREIKDKLDAEKDRLKKLFD